MLINTHLKEDLGRDSIKVIMADAARCWLPRNLCRCAQRFLDIAKSKQALLPPVHPEFKIGPLT